MNTSEPATQYLHFTIVVALIVADLHFKTDKQAESETMELLIMKLASIVETTDLWTQAETGAISTSSVIVRLSTC